MAAYYNENDPYAAAWLRNLIAARHIADGIVDERSIKDVRPEDLRGFEQCHFFAGIGVWSYALRLAGWPDDRPVWTGSCPCQPFSAAGKGGGFDDERHLWPEWFRLIGECAPGVVLGEQVASKDGLGWLDAVYADLEGAGYAVGALDLCAAGVGAPHIRQRLWIVAERMADAGRERDERSGRPGEAHGAARAIEGEAQQRERGGLAAGAGSALGGLAHLHHHRREEQRRGGLLDTERPAQWHDADGRGEVRGVDDDDEGLEGQRRGHRAEGGRVGAVRSTAAAGEPGGVADYGREGRRQVGANAERSGSGSGAQGLGQRPLHGGAVDAAGRPSPTNGHWRAADWLWCRDQRWRPVEPGTFPLAHGAPARVGRLRAYGNAIVAPLAAEVIWAYMEGDNAA